jgi:UDP-N-acetylglucosamine 2-epimerase (non-hydrolysing)
MVVVGTRPEIIKMAPIIRGLKRKHMPFTFAHCGQHYDYEMSQQFIEELELPMPDYSYEVKASSQAVQTANILVDMDKLFHETVPSVVLVEGDTNTVFAAALAAVKLGVPVGHVEAGLRSFDLRMPEEHNRRLTDHISTYLFAPTETAERNLKNESVWGKIYVTGNTVIDAVVEHMPLAMKKSGILQTLPFDKFILATAHRAENVDDLSVLKNFMDAFAEAPLPVVYPMHPRTRKRVRQNKLWLKTQSWKNIHVLPPLGYFDFLVLMKKCEMIVTDSGGIQEEATAPPIRKPVLVARLSTERPEAVKSGFAQVVGTEKQAIIDAMEKTLKNKKELPKESPYGDGNAAEKILMPLSQEMLP